MNTTTLRRCCAVILVTCCWVSVPCDAQNGLHVSNLGRLSVQLADEDELQGSQKKWAAVQHLLGDDAERVVIKQLAAQLGGNTSVRSEAPLKWKESGYFRRARDLGQVFTAPSDFQLDAIILRTGNAHLAFLSGARDAEVFVQLFRVTGTPVIDDNGTPPGKKATHGFSTNHRCDDFITGVKYEPLRVISGGKLPDLARQDEGKLTYLKWDMLGEDEVELRKGGRYAFMVGFASPGAERNFTLANRNNASSTRPPAMADRSDTYHGGWGLRREGNGNTPPVMIPGKNPPGDPDKLRRLREESMFPTGKARFAISPTCDGYPDVDTYRDHEFYILSR